MRYYHYYDTDAGVDLTVITDGIETPQRETILRVEGINDASISKGLNIKTLAPITQLRVYLVALAVTGNLNLIVTENQKKGTTLNTKI